MHPADKYLPYETPRENQQKVLRQVHDAIQDGVEVVIVDAPTGTGKSGINVAIARSYDGNVFMTTPLTELREQLENDEILNKYLYTLDKKANYTCTATGETLPCKDCVLCDKSCFAEGREECEYREALEDAFDSNIVNITLARLLVDSTIPTYTNVDGETVQLSFDNRGLLIVDECQDLEGQVAGLFAGFKFSEYTVPEAVYQEFEDDIQEQRERKSNMKRTSQGKMLEIVEKGMEKSQEHKKHLCEQWAEEYGCEPEAVTNELLSEVHRKQSEGGNFDKEKQRLKELEKCLNLRENVSRMKKEREDGDTWVADVKDNGILCRPVRVDKFLQERLWNRADQIILSSATIPFRNNIETWLDIIGLKDREHRVIKTGSPFPVENRQIINYTVGSMSRNRWKNKHLNDIVSRIQKIMEDHEGERGVIHTTSYFMANIIGSRIDDVKVHYKDEDTGIIDRWQMSGKQALISPSVKQGVDLKGDEAEWQVLLKTPWPSLGDNRIRHIKNNEPYGQKHYQEMTAISIVQSAGRAVRSKTDVAPMYILDDSFFNQSLKICFPKWFQDAIVYQAKARQ